MDLLSINKQGKQPSWDAAATHTNNLFLQNEHCSVCVMAEHGLQKVLAHSQYGGGRREAGEVLWRGHGTGCALGAWRLTPPLVVLSTTQTFLLLHPWYGGVLQKCPKNYA